MRRASLVLLLFAPALLADPVAKAPEPRELKTTDLRLPPRPSEPTKPTKITSAAELAKAVPDKNARSAIAKQVDLKREYMLLFDWSGSSDDRLTFRVSPMKIKPPVVMFTYKRGRRDDLLRHVKLFALPKTKAYRLEK
jgi:hypothetical protein